MRKNKLPFLLGAILGAGLFILLILVVTSLPDIKSEVNPTAILVVTPYKPTPTAFIEGEQTGTGDETQATALPGVFSIDMRVRVLNTGGDGLKIHSEPNIDAQTLTVAAENSIWKIMDGPTIEEGRVWWKVWSEESGMSGWAVQDYLTAEY